MSDFIISNKGTANDSEFNIKQTGISDIPPVSYTIDENGYVIFNFQYPTDKYTNDGLIEVGSDGMPVDPILVLSSRGGNKIGVIENVVGIEQTHPLSEPAELSFDVYKEANGRSYANWDNLKDFKLVQIPRENNWFEAKVSIDEENDLIKHVTCVHANEAELGQINLYDTEINTDADIERDDYKETFFYNEEDPDASLLHRILKDKAPHYQIYHVDSTLVGLFRQFSFNGVSIQEALNQIGEECNCLFIYGEWSENDGEYHRTLSAYDLEDYCYHCGKRGNYTDGVCTNCGSDNINYGYGEDTGIFISRENLANSIEYDTNTDEVKNCFRLVAGDDIMTSAIKACNPTMSQYIWYFSDDMLEDMSDELAHMISEYNELVEAYRTTEDMNISSNLVDKYNQLVDIYNEYNEDLVEIEYPIIGTTQLISAYYNALNLYGFLKSELAPEAESVQTTTADEQMAILQDGDNMAKVGISDVSGFIPYTTANSAIASYAKVYIDTSRYKVNVFTTDITGTTWTGNITLTSYTDDEDTATEEFEIELFDGSDSASYAEWVEQSVQKAMANKEATNLSITDLFKKEESVQDFADRLNLYSLDNLNVMNSMVTSAITIMVEQGVADASNTTSEIYEQLYEPYLNKAKAIEAEIAEREEQLSYLLQPTDDEGNTDPRYPSLGLIDVIEKKQNEIATLLNLHDYLGDELWEELSFYRRENEYQNSNYISDGLTDSEIIEYAERFYEDANKEIIKSATLQHTISAPLSDFLLMPEFYNLQGKFKSGNWLHLQVDGKVYKLRLVNWTVDYDSIEDLDVEFSDVIRCGNIISDTQSILSKSKSMSTTYDYTARQANKGKDASETLQVYKDSGIDFSKIKAIVSRGNTNIVYDDDGILLKRVDGTETLPEQARIYNNGIYVTKDAWETVSTGLGHYSYVDPETGETIETYGIIADTVIGKLIIGDDLGIYSQNASLKMDSDGFVVTAKPNQDNSDLFTIRRDTGNVDGNNNKIYETYIHVDSNGNLVISGNSIVIGNQTVAQAIDDARKVASNYLSADSSGIMVANLASGTVAPASIQTGKNVLITSEELKIREGQTQLASYGDAITIGETGVNDRNVYIDSNGVNIREGTNTSIAAFGDSIRIGKENNNNIQITQNTFSGHKYIFNNDETIEIFNITVNGANEDASPLILKTTGDSVSYDMTCSSTLENRTLIGLRGVVNLENGQVVSVNTGRYYIPNDSQQQHDTYRRRVDGYDYTTTYIQIDFDWVADSLTTTMTAYDNNCPIKIESIQFILNYAITDSENPHYRFGVHDNEDEIGEDAYIAGDFSFDIGKNNNPVGFYSLAHGARNESLGTGSIASGIDCISHKEYSLAQGNSCETNGECAQSFGKDNQANGDYSHVTGIGNIAKYEAQTVVGKYATSPSSNDLFIVGNGTDKLNRSYAMRLRDSGNVEFSGAVGSGLTFASKAEMITKMSDLRNQVAYSFFAQPSWTSFAINATSTASSFGTICKMNSSVWYINFTSNETVYMAKYNVTNDTLSTKQLAFVTP